MVMLGELAMTVVLIAGASCLIWVILGLVLRPTPARDVWMVLEGRGDGESLEGQLRWLAWLRETGLLSGGVLVLDRGLTPLGRDLVLQLALRWPWVFLCPAGTLEEWLSEP